MWERILWVLAGASLMFGLFTFFQGRIDRWSIVGLVCGIVFALIVVTIRRRKKGCREKSKMDSWQFVVAFWLAEAAFWIGVPLLVVLFIVACFKWAERREKQK